MAKKFSENPNEKRIEDVLGYIPHKQSIDDAKIREMDAACEKLRARFGPGYTFVVGKGWKGIAVTVKIPPRPNPPD